jgi:hypothetical protein
VGQGAASISKPFPNIRAKQPDGKRPGDRLVKKIASPTIKAELTDFALY